MTKPIEMVAQFNAQASTYCRHIRRAPTGGWRCNLVTRATGVEPCIPEDWAGCKLNSGGLASKEIVEKLS